MLSGLKRTRIYRPGMNKLPIKRLDWEHIENIPRQEGRKVVKGTSKRVVVVKSPDPKFFEQAIFILREDLKLSQGEGGADVLREAQKVADEYVKSFASGPRSLLSKIPPAAFAAIGALATAAAWLIIDLL